MMADHKVNSVPCKTGLNMESEPSHSPQFLLTSEKRNSNGTLELGHPISKDDLNFAHSKHDRKGNESHKA